MHSKEYILGVLGERTRILQLIANELAFPGPLPDHIRQVTLAQPEEALRAAAHSMQRSLFEKVAASATVRLYRDVVDGHVVDVELALETTLVPVPPSK